MRRPLIGITCSNSSSRLRAETVASTEKKEAPGLSDWPGTDWVEEYTSPCRYSWAVVQAGGLPVLLAQEPDCIPDYVARCDGFVLTGGRDPKMESFGQPTHPQAQLMHPRRQEFELALIRALDQHPEKPVLGICLGMQLMALTHGGTLHQHLPDLLGEHAATAHADRRRHPIILDSQDSLLARLLHAAGNDPHALEIVSSHHQAVDSPGQLVITARAPDGVIEAIEDPARPFYLGVQWHPEISGPGPLGLGLFVALVRAAARHVANGAPRTSVRG